MKICYKLIMVKNKSSKYDSIYVILCKMKQKQIKFLSFGAVICHMLSETCWGLRFDCYK